MTEQSGVWISTEQLRAPPGRELVLDYIVERKRMDDLCGSIIDGRFREQKVKVILLPDWLRIKSNRIEIDLKCPPSHFRLS